MPEVEPEHPKDWKLKLRYGRLKTPFVHMVVLSYVEILTPDEKLGTITGPAVMMFKGWARNDDEFFEMTEHYAEMLGANVVGKTELYTGEPEQPPAAKPFGYDINFTPYTEEE